MGECSSGRLAIPFDSSGIKPKHLMVSMDVYLSPSLDEVSCYVTPLSPSNSSNHLTLHSQNLLVSGWLLDSDPIYDSVRTMFHLHSLVSTISSFTGKLLTKRSLATRSATPPTPPPYHTHILSFTPVPSLSSFRR